MKGSFVTSRGDLISIYPSSNIYRRVWLKIESTYDVGKDQATELGVYDIDILISMLNKAKKALQEEED